MFYALGKRVKKFIATIMFLTVIFLVFSATGIYSNALKVSSMHYEIISEWDSSPIQHAPIKITLEWKRDDDFLTAIFEGPFFNDPPAPDGPPGKPFPKLWDYEVAEIFFLAPNKQYLEVEVCPHGQHLLLLLNGTRNAIKDELPMDYTSSIDKQAKTWRGIAKIPLSYLPHDVSLLNAYAIHGSGKERVYESLYPVEKGKYSEPDFHRLEYFKSFDVSKLVEDTSKIGTYWDNL